MTSLEGLNRRRFPRVKYPCLATIWYKDEDSGQDSKEVFLTHTENLGIGGVAILGHQRFKLFTPVDLELDLLDMADHVRCHGKIVWLVQRKYPGVRGPVCYDIGLEFQDLKEEETARIAKIVQRLEKYQE